MAFVSRETPQGQIYIADSRNMAETPAESVALVVTSPPYWHIKDYGVPNQIGYWQMCFYAGGMLP